MRLAVLGNPDRYLAPLAAGSGYLLEAGDATVLLDAGPGVRSALKEEDVTRLDAIVISHFHYDHCLDLPPILKCAPKGMTLIVPPGAKGNLAALARAYGFDGPVDAPGPIVEARGGQGHAFKKLRLDFASTQHGIQSIATRARVGSRSIVYASDTAPCEGLHRVADRADLLLLHTLLPTVEEGSDHARIHCTAESGALAAKRASAKRVLLSHRFHESKDEDMLDAAKRHHDDVTLAKAERVYEIT